MPPVHPRKSARWQERVPGLGSLIASQSSVPGSVPLDVRGKGFGKGIGQVRGGWGKVSAGSSGGPAEKRYARMSFIPLPICAGVQYQAVPFEKVAGMIRA